MGSYRVDSIHIGVEVIGDSAIHLLVQEQASGPAIVKRAVLIDGGAKGGEKWIANAIEDIQTNTKRYDLSENVDPAQPGILKFDAVIITHWDQDHWQGILYAMANDITAQKATKPPKDPTNDYQVSFLRYAPGDTGKPRVPKTILYCPAEGQPTSKAPKFTPKPPNASSVPVTLTITGGDRVDAVILMRMEPTGAPVANATTLLAVDVFTGVGLKVASGSSTVATCKAINNPTALIATNKPGAGQPAMYIVGVSERILGPNPPSLRDTMPSSPHGVEIVDETSTHSKKNKSSLATMIMWDTTPPRLSHYSAGDMFWRTEQALVNWTGTTGDRTKLGEWVTTVKLSHHGAKSSTPATMMNKFNPRAFVASAGEANGHPSWEFLLYLEGWIYSGDLSKSSYQPLLATQFPYFLIRQKGTPTDPDDWLPLPKNKSDQMSMKVLEGKGTVDKDYLNAVKGIYLTASAAIASASAVTLTDPITSWENAILADPNLDPKNWVRTWIAKAWNKISKVPPTAHAGVGVARTTSGHTIIGVPNQLWWYRIESHNDPEKDGTTFVRYATPSFEDKLWPPLVHVPPTPRKEVIPYSRALGLKRSALNMYSDAASNEDPVTKKLKKSLLPAVEVTNPGSYNPAPGTNPDENDDMVDEDEGGDDVADDSMRVSPEVQALSAGDSEEPSAFALGNQPTLNPPFYYICASTVQYDGVPGPDVQQLATADPLNNFLSTLHLQGIILGDQPSSSGATNLHSQDELQSWLVAALQGSSATAPKLSVTSDATTLAINGFVLTLTDSSTKVSSTFSSAGAVVALNAKPDWGLEPSGVVPWQNSLVLGLSEVTQPSGYSLLDILKPANDRGATLTGLEFLQLALGDKLQFNLDVAPGSRNATWFDPMASYKTVSRLQYIATETSKTSMNAWISGFLTGFSFQSITAITKLQNVWVATAASAGALNSWEFILTTTVALEGVDVVSSITLDFAGSTLAMTIQLDYNASEQASLLGQMLAWIQSQKNLDSGFDLDFSKLFEKFGKNFNAPLFRRLRLTIDLDANGLPTGNIEDLSIDLELGVNFGQPGGNTQQKVVFLFTYEWSKARGSVLRGSLWTAPPPAGDVDRRLLPEYEPYQDFEPCSISDTSAWANALDLTNLVPSDPSSGASGANIDKIPDGIPTQVIMAVLELDSTSISFAGAIECLEPTADDIPKLFLSRLTLDAKYTYAGQIPGFSLAFGFGAAMYPEVGSMIIPIEMRGLVLYDSNNGWSVAADVETPGMQGAHFRNFFDENAGAAATSLIQSIQLLNLHLEYQYQNPPNGQTNAAKSFSFSGDLLIGKLELTFSFNYTGKDTWDFSAAAGGSGEDTTIQEILDSIVGDGTVNLPSCVGDIVIGVPPAPPSGSTIENKETAAKEFFNIKLTREPPDTKGNQNVIFTVSVYVAGIGFTFLQFRNTSWDINKTPSKRFFRIEVNKLPDVVNDIPIISELAQPFDEMYFMWVQADSQQDASSPPGLTKSEVSLINNIIPNDPVYYKLNKDASAYGDDDVIVQAGCHFVIVAKDQTNAPLVVLDYAFAQPTASVSSAPPPLVALKSHAAHQLLHGPNAVIVGRPPTVREPITKLKADDSAPIESAQADAGGGTTKAPMKKSIGPFSISNIGLKFSNSTLSICMDAEIALGPIALSLMGFSIDLNFSKGGDIRNNLPTPGVSLQGLAASFNQPPLTIAGGLMKELLASGTFYAGGIDVGFAAWLFLAAGGYGSLTDPQTRKSFKSLFAFAKLEGPLVTLEFATISGITGGFGYNNALTLPTIAQVPNFPFLKMPDVSKATGQPVMDTLMALINSGWFNPLDGSFWVGAGLTVSAFEMLQITAVAVVQWGNDVQLGLYAVAVADVPSTAATEKLAHIELGILAMVDFGKGLAKFEAQLAPSSYILDPSCHLSGGFALYYWFLDGPQQTKGDWVFSIGGYHPMFKPPPQYPVPPRLQISWSLGPISILGQAYFAITPNLAMAGAVIHASLGIGVLQAFFDAYTDFLINFKPFTFTADGGVSVGVRFTLDLLFVTIHISIEIGATLVMQGPPICGTCHVDFWVFGFDINFGTNNTPPAVRASLSEFYSLVLQKGSPAAGSSPPLPLTFTCKTGLIPSSSTAPSSSPTSRSVTPETRKARYRAKAKTKASEKISRKRGRSNSEVVTEDPPVIWEVKAGMFTYEIASVFALSKVTLYPGTEDEYSMDAPSKPETAGIYSRPMYLQVTDNQITSNLKVTIDFNENEEYRPKWKLSPKINNVPRALWDAYDPKQDPTTGSSDLATDTAAPTAPLMTGVLLAHPDPTLSQDKIPAFDAVKSQLQDVFPDPPALPKSTTKSNAEWLPVPPTIPPDDDPAKNWENIQNIWTENETQAIALATLWAQTMGWGDSEIHGNKPERLVEDLQELYVAAPLVSVPVAG